jgi:hypothetical protein
VLPNLGNAVAENDVIRGDAGVAQLVLLRSHRAGPDFVAPRQRTTGLRPSPPHAGEV